MHGCWREHVVSSFFIILENMRIIKCTLKLHVLPGGQSGSANRSSEKGKTKMVLINFKMLLGH